MTETATIMEIIDRKVKVRIVKGDECKSCGGKSCKVEGREFIARNGNSLNLEIGDMVRVYLPPGKAILASFMILILPLILFLVCYFVFGAVLKTDSEGIKALFGVLGMAGGFCLSLLVRKSREEEDMPLIVRKQDV